ncbi:MAG: FCD domain-containing protein [Clostridiales bacterium]|nr:FCD domain-containing protein [Clostridiales bacterium]
MDVGMTEMITQDDINNAKAVFSLQSELMEYLLLKIMHSLQEPIGSLTLKIALDKWGFNVGTATIGRSLKIMDSYGYTYQVANKGRMLTDMGVQKVQHMQNLVTERNLGLKIVEASKARKDNISDLIDLMVARKTIECQAIRLAAAKAEEKDLKEINWALMQHRMIVDRKLSPAGAGLDFHIMIVRASKNRFMEAVVKLLAYEERNIEFKTLKLSTFAHAAAYVDKHREIFDALMARDADNAERLMSEHFDNMIDTLILDLK